MPDIDVSVVMPAFNAAATIDEALQSALSQDGASIEVLVVDDGSRDDTVARARAHGDRVRVISQANAGPQVARNRGIEASRGEFIAFLDSDDVWLPGKLAAQLAALSGSPDAVASYTGWHVWEGDSDGHFERPAQFAGFRVGTAIDPARSGWLYTTLLLDCVLLTSTVLLRASTVRRIGAFDASLRVGEDYDLWLRLSQAGPIIKLADVGTLYRFWVGSASRRPLERNFELEVLERALARWGGHSAGGQTLDPARLADRVRKLRLDHAGMHLERGTPRVALQQYAHLLRSEPLNPWLWRKTLQSLARAGTRRP